LSTQFIFNEDQEQFRENLARFLADKSPTTEVRAQMADIRGYDPAVWSMLNQQLGLSGIAIAEQYGGAGFGPQELAIACEEMGRSLYCGPFFASAVCAAHALSATGNEAQKQQWLPGIASGEIIACLAITEHAPMWSDEDIRTTATSNTDGKYQLSGTKHYVIDAQVAEVIFVAAREIDGSIALFATDTGAHGLTIAPVQSMDATRKLNTVTLANTPAERLGKADLPSLMDYVLVALSNEMIGGTQALLQSALDYTQLRFQFGRSIASFQAIKHRLAELLLEVELAKSAAYQAAHCLAANEDVREHASLAKAAASEAYVRVASECIQLHGGIGFTWENDTHLWFKRAKSSEVLLGTPAAHRERMLHAITHGARAKARIG
jgi:alkylation response protein AidB-like acyl-CoA dehydrogenase